MTANAWTVTTTHFDTTRRWGARFEWMGLGYVLHIGVSSAPAMRLCLFGCGIWFGRIPPKPKVQVLTKTVTTGGDYSSGEIVTTK
ncbi:hypothetical protein EBZ39_01540 [bacterium]|nr:hypothetical protein [bacterium]